MSSEEGSPLVQECTEDNPSKSLSKNETQNNNGTKEVPENDACGVSI